MNIQHFFLTAVQLMPSGRWLETFPGGKVVSPSLFMRATDGLQPAEFMVWVPTDDPQWTSLLLQIGQLRPGAKSIALSGAPTPQEGLYALNAGAVGYAHSYSLPELFAEVATVVQLGGVWAGRELMQSLVSSASAALETLPLNPAGKSMTAANNGSLWSKLSGREMQVACKVAEGHSNKEVADALFISERTVKAHLGSVFDKLGVRDRLQLAVFVATISPEHRISKE